MEKGLLLIDDSNDHVGVLPNISNYLRTNENILVKTFHINPLDKQYWDKDKDPNIDLVIIGIVEILLTYTPALIVVDQYYSDANFNGINLISKLREIAKFKSCKIFLISGKRDKIVRDIFQNVDLKDVQKVNELSKIISYGINRFLDKNFKDEAIEVLKKKQISDILYEKFREYENSETKVNLFSPKYSCLTFKELADYIESESHEASIILEEMFELTISHYVNIDEALK